MRITKTNYMIYIIGVFFTLMSSPADNLQRESLVAIASGDASAVTKVLIELDNESPRRLASILTIMNPKLWKNQEIASKVLGKLVDWHDLSPEIYLIAVKKTRCYINDPNLLMQISELMNANEQICKDIAAVLMIGAKEGEIRKTSLLFSSMISPESQFLLAEISEDALLISQNKMPLKRVLDLLQTGSFVQLEHILMYINNNIDLLDDSNISNQVKQISKQHRSKSIRCLSTLIHGKQGRSLGTGDKRINR